MSGPEIVEKDEVKVSGFFSFFQEVQCGVRVCRVMTSGRNLL